MRPFIHIPDWAIKYIKRDNLSAFEILGHIKASVQRADGYRFVHFDEHNAIQTILKTMVATNIQDNTSYGNMALDNLFASVAHPDDLIGQDGIAVYVTATWYSCDCVGSGLGWTVTGNPGTLTGQFTGYAGTIADEDSVILGRYASNVSFATEYFTFKTGGAANAGNYAKPTSWPSLDLLASDVLTIAWTLTVA